MEQFHCPQLCVRVIKNINKMSKKLIFILFILACVALWLIRVYSLHDDVPFRTSLLVLGGWCAFRFFFRGTQEGGWFRITCSVIGSLVEILLIAILIGIINNAVITGTPVPTDLFEVVKDLFGYGNPSSQQPLTNVTRIWWIISELVAPASIGLMCGIAYRNRKK